MNYRKNVQKPSRLLSFLTRFLRTIAGLFRKPPARPWTEPTKLVARERARQWSGPTRTEHHGFGNPLTRKRSWWIPPDERAEPVMATTMKHSNEHRKLLRRVHRQRGG